MANHIQNRLQFAGSKEDVEKLLSTIKGTGKDGSVFPMDFNKIVPMPEELNITSSSLGSLAQLVLFGTGEDVGFFTIQQARDRFSEMDEKLQLEAVHLGIKYHNNEKKYGHATWDGWAEENWGTKWNAYSQPDKRDTVDTIHFQTAWLSPVELIKKLSEQHPNVNILLTYADEDSGSNTGRIELLGGVLLNENYPKSQSVEGYKLYFELHPDMKADFQLVDGKYEYKG